MKTHHEHSFGRHIVVCLVTALGICAVVELTCLALGIAPLFTANLPLNEKMRFLREHRISSVPMGVISGASIALNDIDSDLLEDDEKRPFINLGANGVSVPTAEQFYKQLADLYPVREVIFAASPVEMRDAFRSDVQVPTPVFRRYVLGRMTMAEEFTYRDISGLMSYWKNWDAYHNRRSPSSMAFSKTGAVPLELVAESRAGVTEAFDLNPHCVRCTTDLAQFCRDVRSENRAFTVVLGPVFPGVINQNPNIRAAIADRKQQIQAVVQECHGRLFDITDYASVDDSCFANSLHLNAQGMTAMTAQFERFRRGESIPKGTSITCGSGIHLATSPSSMQGVSSAPAASD